MPVNGKKPTLVRRMTVALSIHEEQAVRWKARQLGLRTGRGRLTPSLVFRDFLKAVVAEYDKRPQ